MKALTATTATGWSELDWDFGTTSDLPLLRSYATDADGKRKLTPLLVGQRGSAVSGLENAGLEDADGDGLMEIWTLNDLNNIRNNLSGNYELATDLDFRAGCGMSTAASACDYPNWVPQDGSGNIVAPASGTNAGWIPIGTGSGSNAFSGTFDGNGHTISNLFVRFSASSGHVGAGLFGDASGTLENLGLTGEHMAVSCSYSSFTQGSCSAGGLAGSVSGTGIVKNCYSTGDISSSSSVNSAAGGLLGGAWSVTTISDCYSTGNVSSSTSEGVSFNAYASGLVGSGGTITNCYATGNVSSTSPNASRALAGGVVASSFGGTVSKSYYSGVVKKGTSSSLGSAIQTSGQYKTETALKTPTAPGATSSDTYHGWSEEVWDFGGSTELPTLRVFAGGGAGVAVSFPSVARYVVSEAGRKYFTLSGSAVPAGTERHFFVHTTSLAKVGLPYDIADGGPDGVRTFSRTGDDGKVVRVGQGGAGANLACQHKIFCACDGLPHLG